MFVRASNNPFHPCATALATFAAILTLAGCGVGPSSGSGATVSSIPQIGAVLTGRVMGGQQPVSGASITLWQVNSTGAAATSMLKTAVTTDSNGNFSITSDYPNSNTSCTSTTEVYILATGGNPGSGTNSALALMTALGPCSALNANTVISINEVTTVASVWALQQFFGESIGTPGAEDIAIHYSGSSTSAITTQSITGLNNAFALVPTLVNIAAGMANATSGIASMNSDKLYMIANILSSCVNSSNSSGNCATLFAAVTPAGSITPGDTIQAALYMAQNPSNNVPAIAALEPSSPPFGHNAVPGPYDWSLAITYTGASFTEPFDLASDASGDIWVANAGSSAESLVEISPAGALLGTYLNGSNVPFDGPQAVVPDTLGNIWVTAHGGSGSSGNRLVAFNPTTHVFTGYPVTSGCYPYALAIDAHDDLFFACSALGYMYEFPNNTAGTPSSTNLPSYPSSPTQLGPIGSESYGMAIDTLGDLWVANTIDSPSNAVTEYASGSLTAIANTFALGGGPVGVAIDHSNNSWALSSNTLNEYAYNSANNYTPAYFTGAGLGSAKYLSIDGAGNLWATNGATSTLSSTTFVTVSELSNAGEALTQGVTVGQPGGLASATTIVNPIPRGITLDPSGNVWIAGCGSSTSCNSATAGMVVEYIGVATPPILPLATALANNSLGCCSFTPAAPNGTSPTDTAGTVNFVIPAAVNSNNNYAFNQDNYTFNFEITRTGGFSGALSVNYAFIDGTATSTGGSPTYSGGSGTLTWANGDSSVKTIGFNWYPTANYSGTKTLSIQLTCTTECPASFSPSSTVLVTVTDNLTPPSTVTAFKNLFSSASSNYTLGLPIDEYGGTGGAGGYQFAWETVSSNYLTAGFSDPYFYLNGSNQMVFTAPSNGATSSPGSGSDDTRSEMRENYTGSNNIDSNDFDSAVGGTLTANVAVNATSVDTNEATIGQVHGQNNPFVLLQYQPTSSTQGNIVLNINNTNTTNSGSTGYTIATGINLGSFFTYVLKFNSSGVTATVNGSSITTMPIVPDSSWLGTCGGSSCTYDDGVYFKWGAYSGAPNTGNPAGDETQVTFSSVTVTHP